MRYTMTDLIESAKEQRFNPKPRLIQDWTELGLLDRPERHGLGRGKGISSTWSEEQRGLFLKLLELRAGVTRVGPLCNVPVWTWLYFGDTYVPLRQARRALGSWEGRTTSISWQTARRTARQLLDTSVSGGQRKDLEAVLDQVAGILLRTPRKFGDNDEATLLGLLRQALDPHGTGLVGTVGGMAFTPEAYVELLKARMAAISALGDDLVDESLFHWARYADLVSRSQYQRHLASMSTSDAASGLTIPTIDQLVSGSCLTLVTLLGLGLVTRDDQARAPLDRPAYWQDNNLRTVVRGEQAAGGVKITVDVKPAEQLEGSMSDQ